jgi:uncharacterized protein
MPPPNTLTTAIPDLPALLAAVEAGAAEESHHSFYHGPRHWRDVARIGLALASATEGVDSAVVFLFALLHDTQHFNDGDDPGHGPRAAVFVAQLAEVDLIKLDDIRLANLLYACNYHTGASANADPTIGCCLDADRLTLWRVGEIPLPEYLTTPSARRPGAPEWSRELLKSPDISWEHILAAYAAGESLDPFSF